MKKTVNKIICVLLSAVMLLTLAPAFTALADDEPVIVSSGYCGAEGDGTNLAWTLDSAGTLVISGSGSIKDSAFSKNAAVKAVVIESGVTGIGMGVFAECNSLVSAVIPDTVTVLGNQAFYRCRALKAIDIPGSIEEISYFAFEGDIALQRVTLGYGVKRTSNHSFGGCIALTDLTIPETLDYIWSQSFSGCSKLANVTVPADAFVGKDAFNGTAFLNAMPDGMVYLGATAYGYKGTMPMDTDITVRNGVKYVPGYLFSYNKQLRSISFPDSIEKLENAVFLLCSNLQSVHLPAGFTNIPAEMFRRRSRENRCGRFRSLFRAEIARAPRQRYRNRVRRCRQLYGA